MKIIAIPIFGILVFLSSCNPSPGSGATENNVFHTTAPSQLYFKNMRSVYYGVERKANKIDVFHMRRFDGDKSKKPLLIPLIVNNWLADEAYLLLEHNSFEGWPDTLQIMIMSEGQEEDILVQSSLDREAQLLLAIKLADVMQKGHELLVLDQQNKWIPFFEDKRDRYSFITTVRDYENLTDAALKKSR